jgi:MFS family permease
MLALLRRNPSFRRLFGAQLVSYCGDWFANVALIGLLLDITDGSALAASLVFLAATLPAFLVTPIAGPAADRFDRRRLMLAVSLAQAVAALGFLTVGDGRWWLGLIAQALVSGLGAFVPPITGAAVPNLVDEADLHRANVLIGSTWGMMLAVGAALGGLFTSLFGRTASFVADSLTFLVAALLVLRIDRPMQGERGPGHAGARMRPLADTAVALRFARREPAVLALLGSKMGFGLTGGVVAVLALVSTETFDRGDSGTGLLLAARGVGVVLGPVIAGRLARRGVHGILLACGWSALVYGAGYALVAGAPLFWLALAAVAVAHLGGGAQWTLSTMGLQMIVPDALRGRVLAADFALVSLSLSISIPGFGALAGWLGPTPALLIAVVTSAAWGTAYLFLTRRLRSAEPAALPDGSPPVTGDRTPSPRRQRTTPPGR